MAILQKIGLYWHTLRTLRPIQWYGRFKFYLAWPRVDRRPAPKRRLTVNGKWIMPACRQISMAGPERFSFLNETKDLSGYGWDDPALAKLWRYNLHYFDDLNALAADRRKDWHWALIERWIKENPPAVGTGWEPYPVSLRIVNWIKWALKGNELSAAALDSLAIQIRWLTQRLEYHLLGNHLFTNGKALVFAGLFFEGEEAEGWLKKGLHILLREIDEQILADGGHFELSPMYHALVLEDMLDLCNICATFPGALDDEMKMLTSNWRQRIRPMSDWLAAMCHPDGEISFFNDAAIAVAPPPAELADYAVRLGLDLGEEPERPLVHLAESGYIRLRRGPVVAILDVGRIGPDYLPGHGHADTLSFELSVGMQRVLVNSGTSVYGAGAERLRQRGTDAHNTLSINGENSSQVWAGFRVARRARPIDLDISETEHITVSCGHDGYRYLSGKPVHRRLWRFGGNELIIEDKVSGTVKSAIAWFHFHPDRVIVFNDDEQQGSVSLPDGARLAWQIKAGAGQMRPSSYHPQFGVSRASNCLAVKLDGGRSVIKFSWY